MIEIGKVISSTPGTILVAIENVDIFERNKSKIKISRYVSIEDGNDLKILASIQNVSAVQSSDATTIRSLYFFFDVSNFSFSIFTSFEFAFLDRLLISLLLLVIEELI